MTAHIPNHALKRLGLLLLPSLPLLGVCALYFRYKSTPHFLLHTLVGWDVALILLLLGTYLGRSWSRWDGLLPLILAVCAMAPDLIYAAGPEHRDWMDIFLFHIALDEILWSAIPVLTLLWLILSSAYCYFHSKIA